jgi:SanA protein
MKDKKTINPFWQFRVEAAYRLWKAKKIEKLLVSGDIGWYGQNELEDFREAFLALGIPDSAMVFDYVGFRTHDSVIRCKEVFGQKKVTIISQEFHNERALYIADHFGLEAVGYNAEMVSFRDNIRNSIRERLARILLFMDLYVLDSEPHILGRKVVIP